jgi:hypothetical protein
MHILLVNFKEDLNKLTLNISIRLRNIFGKIKSNTLQVEMSYCYFGIGL